MKVLKNKNLKVGTKLSHKFRGECIYSKQAFSLERLNPDPSSIFVEFKDGIDQVSINLVTKIWLFFVVYL